MMGMDPTTKRSWCFTIEFDEAKAARHWYSVDDLYDCVGRIAERFGNIRIAHDTWKAQPDGDEVMAQCAALSRLARTKWVMDNVKSWTAYEDDELEGHDYLQVLREVSPHLVCDE